MIIVDNGKQCRHRGEVVVWRSALQQLNDGAAHAPYVRSRAGTRELDDFRGHPVRGAHDLSLLVLLTTRQRARGDAKVGKLDGAVLSGENVCALDVAVDDTLVVEVVEALEDLCHVDADEVLGELSVGL